MSFSSAKVASFRIDVFWGREPFIDWFQHQSRSRADYNMKMNGNRGVAVASCLFGYGTVVVLEQCQCYVDLGKENKRDK